mmetsp:Transcript_64157/g.106061  ORF Transcript_64157/g.106061 Transcript_64157/m.106061 type:complete len:216 (-) Transcript_64157:2486-3133(-)
MDLLAQRRAVLLRVAQQHVGVGLVEHGVLDPGVAGGQGPLENDALLGEPDLQHGHPGNGRVGVVLCRAVDRVVGADDQRHVCSLELVVDLVHFEHDVVRDIRLRQQHVQLPRHASSDGVDGEGHLHLVGAEAGHHLRDRVLPLSHGESVPGDDDDLLRRDQLLHDVVEVDYSGLAFDGHLRALGGAQTAKDHGDDGAVHGLAHDPRQNGTAGPNQ